MTKLRSNPKHFTPVTHPAFALAGLMLWLVFTPATAASPGNLADCRAIADSAQRLACYDALSKPAGEVVPAPAPAVPAAPVAVPAAAATPFAAPATAPQAVAAPPQTAAAAPAVPADQPQSFGAETVEQKRVTEEGVRSMSAHVAGIVDGLPRGTVFHLDNGQIWKSIDDRQYDYYGDHPAVVITRNLLGNYWMHFEHGAFNLRVSRIQ